MGAAERQNIMTKLTLVKIQSVSGMRGDRSVGASQPHIF